MVTAAFGGARESIRIVDYGGGNGLLASLLQKEGFQAATYDPFYADCSALPAERFDLITCFEVMEHVPFPSKTMAEIASLLKDHEGAILFSTLLQPSTFAQMGLNWWYVGPRNGHISLHSRDSLMRLFQKEGMQTASFSDAFHLAFRRLPEFASHLVKQ
jgi:2-polyprenyl-6-hydroxyphenyl methylase/3-demethylubiquinone-9 3-methyltransferase